MRRRARFLRKARELAYRDLGGLVFNLHRFGQRNDELVLAKLTTLAHIDAELRAIEGALRERQLVTILREAGIAACPRCAAIHGSEDRFCPNCGLAMDVHAERPVAGPPAAAPAPGSPPPGAASPAPTPPAVAPTVVSPAPAPTPPAAAPKAPPAPAPAPAPTAAPAPARAPAEPASSAPASPEPAEEPTEIVRPSEPGG
jgi:hypothetical protein